MATLFEEKFSRNGINYRVEVSFNDEAIMDGSAEFATLFAMQKEGDQTWTEVSVTAELEWKSQKIILTADLNDQGLDFRHEIALHPFLSDRGDLESLPEGDYEEGFLDGKLADATEQLIHLVPTDPLLGCLVKGALSTLIGQIIRCWPKVRTEQENIRDWATKLRGMCARMAKCLQGNSLKMLGTFTKRFLKCAVFHGLA